MVNKQIDQKFSVVLLCAGVGKRIEKVSKAPKCLLKINNKTILEHNLNIIQKLRIKDVILVVGYKSSKILNFIKKLKFELKIKFIKNSNPILHGNTVSMYLGLKQINDSVVIIDGDLIYEEMVLKRILYRKNRSELVVGAGNINDIECAKTLVNRKKLVKKTIDKRKLYAKEIKKFYFVGEAIGVIKIIKRDIKKFKENCKKFLKIKNNLKLNWEHLINMYVKKNSLNFLKLNKKYKWLEIDTPDDYFIAQKIFKKI